jgi:hypothetical protein
MSSKMPPVPPASQSKKGSGEGKTAPADEPKTASQRVPNPDRQGQQGNTKVNTTHQGYQQDR